LFDTGLNWDTYNDAKAEWAGLTPLVAEHFWLSHYYTSSTYRIMTRSAAFGFDLSEFEGCTRDGDAVIREKASYDPPYAVEVYVGDSQPGVSDFRLPAFWGEIIASNPDFLENREMSDLELNNAVDSALASGGTLWVLWHLQPPASFPGGVSGYERDLSTPYSKAELDLSFV
jgi:hypothetical protein